MQSGRHSPGAAGPARLRRWIVAIGVLATVVTAGSSAFDTWRTYQRAIDDASRELENVAEVLAEQLQGSVQTIDVLLSDTAAWCRAARTTMTAESLDAALASRAAGLSQIEALTIADANGVSVYGSRPAELAQGNIADRPYFRAQRDGAAGGLFVGEPLVAHIDQRTAFVVSRRVTDAEGRFDGIVSAMINLDEYQMFYRGINLGTRSAIVLLHTNGTLVIHQPPVAGAIGRQYPQIAGLATEGPPQTVRTTSPIDGVQRFMAAARVRGFPLLIAVSRDEAAVLKPLRDVALHQAARTMLLALLGVVATAALVRQLRRVEQGEAALRESEERYALALEGASEGHWDWSLDGGRSFLSPTMKALHGRSQDAPVTTAPEWLAEVDFHPDDVPALEAAQRDHLEGRTELYEVDYRVRHADGKWHWLHARGRCLRDGNGVAYRFVGATTEITARKEAEAQKARLEMQLRQSQKLEAMGTLAGGIAHDFNNILGAILGYGEMAQRRAEPDSAVRRYVDNVMQAAGRAKALVERILAFSRSGIGTRAPVHVQAVVQETLELLAASLPHRIRLEMNLAAGDAAIIGDPTQLHQVAMNLCTNAVQAMGDGGVVTVTLERVANLPARPRLQAAAATGAFLRLAVQDTGCGIESELLDRIFDPFFTTKGVGEGTGLGLSLVHGIVSDLGGAIEVDSELGHGTTFTIWLPIAGAAPRPAPPAVVEQVAPGQGEVVMIVDDEHALVALAEEMLAELGYEPVGFRSSAEALAAFRGDPHRFDVVLTDENMPGITGTALADEIRRLRPTLPIVLMSGFSDAPVTARARAAGVQEVLRKPLARLDIAASLARVLAASHAAQERTSA